VKAGFWVAMFCCLPRLVCAAESYPVNGAWAEQDKPVPPLPVAALTKRWYDADYRCRGGSGDSPATDAACDERERYTKRLHALGQCYGKNDQFGPDMRWHQCGPDSLH